MLGPMSLLGGDGYTKGVQGRGGYIGGVDILRGGYTREGCLYHRGRVQWRIYIVKFWTRAPPPGVQILSISCSFWEILAKSYVGAPPPGSWRPLLGEILDQPLNSESIQWRIRGDEGAMAPQPCKN